MCSVRKLKEQVKGTSFENVTRDRERRKKSKEKILNVLTNRKRTPPQETGMIDLTPCKDNEKSNVSSDKNYSNSSTILSEMSEIHPIREIESHSNVLRRPVETSKKGRVFFTKDNEQNLLEDSSLDFTKNINNGNSNTYDQIARTNFSDLFKALKEEIRRCFVEQKRQWNLPLPLETLMHREMIHLCTFYIQGIKSWSIFCSLLKRKNHLKKLLR